MKVQVVTVDRAGGKKLCVQVVWQENGKTKKQNKEVFGLNEKRLAEKSRKYYEGEEIIDAVNQQISFEYAFNSYIKTLEQGTLNIPEYISNQVGVIRNHIISNINKPFLSDYTMADFKYTTLPLILASKKVAWRTKNGEEYYIRLKDAIGKKTVKEVIGELKKFIKYCAENGWKTDYSILTFKFQKNFFVNYTQKITWMPQPHQLLTVINKEPDIQLKTLWKLAAEIGCRPNETLAICYDDVDFDNGTIDLKHSLSKYNDFRPFTLKTGVENRDPIMVSDELLNLLNIWMKSQLFPKTLKSVVYKDPYTGKMTKRNFVRIFNLKQSRASKKIKQSAKALGIDWKSGMSPFRKWSVQMSTDLKDQDGNSSFNEKQLDKKFGNTKKIRDKHYNKNLNLNGKKRRTAINLNQITEG
jgi:integrase|tara:strand:+ start:78 stop:1316 length:1239 start_codon:yes stop_codon:yes gene_type:complete